MYTIHYIKGKRFAIQLTKDQKLNRKVLKLLAAHGFIWGGMGKETVISESDADMSPNDLISFSPFSGKSDFHKNKDKKTWLFSKSAVLPLDMTIISANDFISANERTLMLDNVEELECIKSFSCFGAGMSYPLKYNSNGIPYVSHNLKDKYYLNCGGFDNTYFKSVYKPEEGNAPTSKELRESYTEQYPECTTNHIARPNQTTNTESINQIESILFSEKEIATMHFEAAKTAMSAFIRSKIFDGNGPDYVNAITDYSKNVADSLISKLIKK